PEEFVRTVLVDRLHAAAVVVGENFRFGHRAAGDVAQLAELGEKYDFTVEGMPLLGAGGARNPPRRLPPKTAARGGAGGAGGGRGGWGGGAGGGGQGRAGARAGEGARPPHPHPRDVPPPPHPRRWRLRGVAGRARRGGAGAPALAGGDLCGDQPYLRRAG